MYGTVLTLTGILLYAYVVTIGCDPYHAGLISNKNQVGLYSSTTAFKSALNTHLPTTVSKLSFASNLFLHFPVECSLFLSLCICACVRACLRACLRVRVSVCNVCYAVWLFVVWNACNYSCLLLVAYLNMILFRAGLCFYVTNITFFFFLLLLWEELGDLLLITMHHPLAPRENYMSNKVASQSNWKKTNYFVPCVFCLFCLFCF